MIDTLIKYREELKSEIIHHLDEREASLKLSLTEKHPDHGIILSAISRIGISSTQTNPYLSALCDLYTKSGGELAKETQSIGRWSAIKGFSDHFPEFVRLAESHINDKPLLASKLLNSTAYYMTHASAESQAKYLESIRKASEIFVRIIKRNLETAPEISLSAIEDSSHNWMGRADRASLEAKTVHERCYLASKLAYKCMDKNPKMAIRAIRQSAEHGEMHKPTGYVYNFSQEKWKELAEGNLDIAFHIAENNILNNPKLSLEAISLATIHVYNGFDYLGLNKKYQAQAKDLLTRIKDFHPKIISSPELGHLDAFFGKETKVTAEPRTTIIGKRTTLLGEAVRGLSPSIANKIDSFWFRS